MIAEMALALVLLIGAGLMIRSFHALQQVHPGFAPDGVLTFRVALPLAKYPNAAAAARAAAADRGTAARAPGVVEVGFTSQLPLTGSGPLSPFAYNEATARNWESETSDGRNVSPGFFRAMGTRVLAGRVFDSHDTPQQGAHHRRRDTRGAGVARRERRRQAAAGRTERHPNNFAEVIGVVEHIRAHDLSRPVRPQIYSVVRRRWPPRRRRSLVGRSRVRSRRQVES